TKEICKTAPRGFRSVGAAHGCAPALADPASGGVREAGTRNEAPYIVGAPTYHLVGCGIAFDWAGLCIPAFRWRPDTEPQRTPNRASTGCAGTAYCGDPGYSASRVTGRAARSGTTAARSPPYGSPPRTGSGATCCSAGR